MEAMTILERCRGAAGDIRRLDLRIQQRRDALASIAVPCADPSKPSYTRGEHDKIPRLLADIDTLEGTLEKRKLRHSAEVAAACVLLDKLPEIESRAMYSYYIMGAGTHVIAKWMRYSETYIRKLLMNGRKAMREIDSGTVAAALPTWYLNREEKET